jgi:O-antigen/teichoic acid export membrane protein
MFTTEMISLKRLKHSRAAKNAGSSYLAFVSTSACALFSIPVAVHYLPKEEIGLWSIVQIIVGYLVWLDLGVGQATGRKIADAIAHDDRLEINRWWTLTVGMLVIQGVLMALVGLGLAPFLPTMLGFAGGRLESQAVGLFVGLALVSAAGMPMRAYPGILLAQERFHWVPLTQAMMPWVQFGIFWFMVSVGFGVYAYLWGLMAAYLAGWSVYIWQVHGMGMPLRFDFSGFTRKRFADLFHYSGNLALNGIATSILASIPSLILTKLGGLAAVPVYNFSQRAPGLVASLSQRTSHAFIPNLQRLYVSGERERFRAKFREVNKLSVWISLGTAGMMLAFNRPFICWLAKADFYAGHWSNLWFACGCLVVPFVNGILSLLQYSGNMGKSAVFTFAQIAVAFPLAWYGTLWFGLAGVAAVFAFVPLFVKAPYGWFRGAKNCGLPAWDLCGEALHAFLLSLAMVVAAGFWIATGPAAGMPIEFLGRSATLPTLREITAGGLIALLSCIMSLRQARIIQRA